MEIECIEFNKLYPSLQIVDDAIIDDEIYLLVNCNRKHFDEISNSYKTPHAFLSYFYDQFGDGIKPYKSYFMDIYMVKDDNGSHFMLKVTW